jgi:hypothetical protein
MPEPFAPVTPETRDLYTRLLEAIATIGPFRVDVKKKSLHLMRRIAFAGVSPEKNFLLLTIRSQEPIENARVIKAEQVSRSRWRMDLHLNTAAEIDAELLNWLRTAYEFCG